MPKTFKEGEKIWLKADEEEGWKRQEAVFVGYEDPPYSDMAIVEVKPCSGSKPCCSTQLIKN